MPGPDQFYFECHLSGEHEGGEPLRVGGFPDEDAAGLAWRRHYTQQHTNGSGVVNVRWIVCGGEGRDGCTCRPWRGK